MTAMTRSDPTLRARRPVQLAAMIVGAVFLLVGIAGIAMARTATGARNYLIGGGVIYAVLWLYGLLIADTTPANFVPMNIADDWLHFVLAVGMVGLGVLLGRD